MKNNSKSIYDIIGISSATICLIHCLVFPLLTIIPFGLTDNLWVDTFFACISMFVVSKIIMGNAAKKVKWILGISILLIVMSVITETFFKINIGLIYIGGIGMIVGHIINYKTHLIE